MKFTKMQGNGNDFIVIKDLNGDFVKDQSELTLKLCNRKYSIGADGILYVRNSEVADIKMEIINSDGSYASMCGNGIRCFAKYVWEKGLVNKKNIKIETGDGIKIAHLNIEDDIVKSVKINMGFPDFTPSVIPALAEKEIINYTLNSNGKDYSINTLLLGVPHTVILGELETFPIEEGRAIEKNELFPQGTNVNFCQVIDRNNVKVKTWERGAGPTLACGTGSCASAVVVNKLGLVDNSINVELPGGHLLVEICDDGVFMTGPAETVYKGKIKE